MRLFRELVSSGSFSANLINEDNLSSLPQKMLENLQKNANIMIFNKKIDEFSLSEPTIIATGSKTSTQLFNQISSLVGAYRAHKYQPIFPIFTGEIEGKELGDNLIVPVTDEQIKSACKFLKNCKLMEGTIEGSAHSGEQFMRAKAFQAALADGTIFRQCLHFKKQGQNLVLQNFASSLSKEEQMRLFSIFPQLSSAEVVEFADMKECTFVTPFACLNTNLSLKSHPGIFLAGRLIMVEGELEAIATGRLAALNMLCYLYGYQAIEFPQATLLSVLVDKIFSRSGSKKQQITINCDIINSIEEKKALKALTKFKENIDARISWHNHLCSQKRW